MERDQHCWQRAKSEERFPHAESPLKVGRLVGAERGLWGIRVECNNQSVEGRSKNCMHDPCHSPAHLSCVSPGVERGWVLESGIWRVDPGRGQLLAVKRQPEGTGVKSSTTRKVCGRNPGHYRSKASLLSGVQGVGSPLQPPFSPIGSCLHGHWEGHPSEQAHPPFKPKLPPPMQALGS